MNSVNRLGRATGRFFHRGETSSSSSSRSKTSSSSSSRSNKPSTGVEVSFHEEQPTGEQIATSTKFTWKITNFTRLTAQKYYSRVFTIDGASWRILIFPKGNNTDNFSVYMDSADSAYQPVGWSKHANFGLILVNQSNSKNSKMKETSHAFTAREHDRGFTSMIPLHELRNSSNGFLVNDTVIVEAEFFVPEIEPIGEQFMTSNKCTWKITNFARLTARKCYSQIFYIGSTDWRLLVYPEGNNTSHLSVYLEVANHSILPDGWTRSTAFSINLVNQINRDDSVIKETHHAFTAREHDRGFRSMIPLHELRNCSNGFLVNDTVIVEAEFVVPEIEPIGEQLRMSNKFTWKITNFARLTARKCYSQIFYIGGHDWRLLVYPEGNNTSHLSVYLEVANHSTLPEGWTRSAAFSINLVNQINRDDSVIKETHHAFTAREHNRGFASMIPLHELRNSSNGFLVNDTVIVEAEFVVPEIEPIGEQLRMSNKFTWKITNFARLTARKCYSQIFYIGGTDWRLLVYPEGNNTSHLSVYLEVANHSTLPEGWTRRAAFSINLVNQINRDDSVIKETHHAFTAREHDRGFRSMIPLHELRNSSNGFLVNDTVIVEAEFFVPEIELPIGEQLRMSNKFTWKITNFARLTARKCYSQIFYIGGHDWRLLVYPEGNNTSHLSVYLEVANHSTLPEGWTRRAAFSINLVNQINRDDSVIKDAHHAFTATEHNRGFMSMIPLHELRNSSNGFLVNDTVIVETEFVVPEIEPIGEQFRMWNKCTWKITNFARLTARKCYSQIFDIGGTDWRLLVYPEGNNTSHLSVYLEVANHSTLPEGWTRSAAFSINLVNQINRDDSVIKGTQNDFNSTKVDWGFTTMILLSELRDATKGFLLNDTLIVEVEFHLPETETGETNSSPTLPTTDLFDSYFTSLEFITEAEISSGKAGTSLHNQADVMTSEAPGIEEIEKAKQYLKECLSNLYKLNMRDRLAEALSTLSIAQTGLSTEQQKAIQAFWSNFSEFTSDFLTFEQDNSEFELQKVTKDQMFGAMKKNHQIHLSKKILSEELEREEEELKRKQEEVKTRREKLVSELEVLITESEEAKSKYKIQEKKVAEAEEKKRISEERMSRSTTAWSNLKAHFA